MMCLQYLGRKLPDIAKIPDGFLLTQSILSLHINMLGVFFLDILLFFFIQDCQILSQLL